MSELKLSDLKGKMYRPLANSHKGENGKLLIIGGSHLFHAASLWALKIASRIVDMVFYHSVTENFETINDLKKDFHDGIIVNSEHLETYISEADCILIGPGLPRGNDPKDYEFSTDQIVKKLIEKYSEKRFVFDASALQEMQPEWLLKLKQPAVLTPHQKEFEKLFGIMNNESHACRQAGRIMEDMVKEMAKKYNCIILLKGEEDAICSGQECKTVVGGNAGMTKGGTGDVLSGLVAALYCKNEAMISAEIGSFVNKAAGDSLFKKVGYYFNATDLVDEIPKVLKELMI